MPDQTTANKAGHGEFEAKATEIATELRNMLTTLVTQLSPLDDWIGLGGTAFQGALSTVQGQTIRLHAALEGIATDVGKVGVGYINADDEMRRVLDHVTANATDLTGKLSPR